MSNKQNTEQQHSLFSDDYHVVCAILNKAITERPHHFNLDRIGHDHYSNIAFSAIARGRLDILQLVLGDKPDDLKLSSHQRISPFVRDIIHNTLMHSAALSRAEPDKIIAIMQYLHSKRLDYAVLHPDGGTPLTGAAIAQNQAVMAFLQQQGVNIEQASLDGESPSSLYRKLQPQRCDAPSPATVAKRTAPKKPSHHKKREQQNTNASAAPAPLHKKSRTAAATPEELEALRTLALFANTVRNEGTVPPTNNTNTPSHKP